ncbi:hypothetical protein [Microvirga pudoricolor]|uniref:hypothetical protein n=1 Tax=Microvirga pudoricolor TaxID=2778729 RepID=UPI001951D3B8|nr:hypothetical protein [Microvirga pudoricolor]MBM6595344.1 hypothetical protein [Microvirga pudoricolor]
MSEEPRDDDLDQQIAAVEREDAVLAAVSSLSHEVRGLGERFEAFLSSAPTTSTQAPEDRDRWLRQTLDRIEARLAASMHKPGATKSAKPRFGLRFILQVVALDLLLAVAVVAGRWSVNDPYLSREDYQMSVYLWQRHGDQLRRCLIDMRDSRSDTSCPLVLRADPPR